MFKTKVELCERCRDERLVELWSDPVTGFAASAECICGAAIGHGRTEEEAMASMRSAVAKIEDESESWF